MLHEVARAVREQLVDDDAGGALHVLLELLDHLRGERAGHDPAQPGVPRVVHVDHRAEVLVELGRQVEQAGRPGGRGEQLRVPARLGHVGVPDQGVVTALRRPNGDSARLEERRRGPAPAIARTRRARCAGGSAQNSFCDRSMPLIGARAWIWTAFRTASSRLPPIVTAARPKRERRGGTVCRKRDRPQIAGSVPAMAIARYPSFVIDCPNAGAMAAFYAALLDWKPDVSGDWANVRPADGDCISFQQVEDYTPPQWPAQQVPQQMHLDVIVDDLDAGRGGGARPSARSSTSTSRAPPSVSSSTRRATRSVFAWNDALAGLDQAVPTRRPPPGSPRPASLGGGHPHMAT